MQNYSQQRIANTSIHEKIIIIDKNKTIKHK